jgi:capsular exopolysaccharide synthesis family protein
MNEEIYLKDVVKACYKRKIQLIAVLIMFLILGMLYTFYIKKTLYKVETQILIDKSDTYIDQVVSNDELCQNKINAKFDKSSKVITATVEMENSEKAFNIINQYIENVQGKLQEIYDLKTFKVIENPEIPSEASNINHKRDIFIALCIGIIIDIIYIMSIFSFSGLTNIYDIEEKLKIKALGIIDLDNKKRKKDYITKNEKIQKQLKRIKANLVLNKKTNTKTILLTGTKNGDGVSYIINNLAIQFANLYSKVLIVDANFKNRFMTNVTKTIQNKGLAELLSTNNVDEVDELIHETKNERIFILPAGEINVIEDEFDKENITNVMEKLKLKYDIILIDSENINENIFPMYLSNITDSTIIVATYGKVRQENLLKTKKEIENVGGKISGIILNKAI